MRKITSLLALGLIHFAAHAEGPANASATASGYEKDNFSEIYFGPQAYHARMRMEGLPPNFTGTLVGATIGFNYIRPWNIYVHLQGDWAIGRMNTSKKPNRFFHDENLGGELGYTFTASKWRIIPFSGLSFHYLIENRKQEPLFLACKFKYQTYNLPLGFRLDYRFNHNFLLGLKPQWYFNLSPGVTITQTNGVLWQLKHKYGARVDLPFEYTFGKSIQGLLRLNPFFQWYEQGASYAITAQGVPLGIRTQVLTYWGGLVTLGIKF